MATGIKITGTQIEFLTGSSGVLTSWGSKASSKDGDYYITPNGIMFSFRTVTPPANALRSFNFPQTFGTIYNVIISGIREDNNTDRYSMLIYSFSIVEFTIKNTMSSAFPVNVVAIGTI